MYKDQFYKSKTIGTAFVPVPVVLPDPTFITTAIASGIATVAATLAASWNDWFPQHHSNWYDWDSSLRNKNFDALMVMTAKMYKDGGINNIDFRSTPSDQLPEFQFSGKKRIELFPLIYQMSNNPFALQIIQEAVSNGILPSSALPQTSKNPLQSITNLFQPSGSNNNSTSQSSISPIVLLAIAGGVIFLITRKKKK